MSKIGKAFENKKAFIAFVTGGDPDIATTEELIVTMEGAGADIIEIGIPFSDPIAEGLVIQRANERALSGGCTVDVLFDMAKRLRGKVSIPLLFMTYLNPIFVYGKGRFMARCADCGIDGVIVPDLPFEEQDELSEVCEANGVCLVSMIAPTSDERIMAIAKHAQGFLYCVSSLGVTGVRNEITADVAAMIGQVRKASSVPCAVGFGISTPEQARNMAEVSDGVIVGSAIVSLIGEHGRESAEVVAQYVHRMKAAIQ
jgi:tryptophan synthase alpha chain